MIWRTKGFRYLTFYVALFLIHSIWEQVPNNHIIPSADELKRRAYCKWHNLFSHATNDCNIFRWQVQSAINKDWLKFQEIQVDIEPFPMNMMNFDDKKVLVWPNAIDKGKGKKIIIGSVTHERPMKLPKFLQESGCRKYPRWTGDIEDHHPNLQHWGQAQTSDRIHQLVMCITDSPPRRATKYSNLLCASWTVHRVGANGPRPRQTV
jgi:hypothetical protein